MQTSGWYSIKFLTCLVDGGNVLGSQEVSYTVQKSWPLTLSYSHSTDMANLFLTNGNTQDVDSWGFMG